MIVLSLAEIADVVGGRLHRADPGTQVTGSVEFDTRKLTPGGLFVALPGEKVDGHDFAAQAVEAGAVGRAGRPRGRRARDRRAAARRGRGPRAVGRADRRQGRLRRRGAGRAGQARPVRRAAPGRGQPDRRRRHRLVRQDVDQGPDRAAARAARPDGRAARVVQQRAGPPLDGAARRRGDPAPGAGAVRARARAHRRTCAEIAPPQIGAVLNVGSAHVGEFGSREGIAKTKGELVEALPEDGVAVLNADDPLVAAMASRTKARVVFVGESASAAGPGDRHHARRPGPRVVPAGHPGRRGGRAAAAARRAPGGNALAAAAVALELGAIAGRGRRAAVGRRSGARRGAWRSSPAPTASRSSTTPTTPTPSRCGPALKALAAMTRESGRRSWAVLGVMGELGADARHRARRDRPAGRPAQHRQARRDRPRGGGHAPGRAPGGLLGRGVGAGAGRRGRRSPCCMISSGPGTSCWSRRPRRPASGGSPKRCSNPGKPTTPTERSNGGDA